MEEGDEVEAGRRRRRRRKAGGAFVVRRGLGVPRVAMGLHLVAAFGLLVGFETNLESIDGFVCELMGDE